MGGLGPALGSFPGATFRTASNSGAGQAVASSGSLSGATYHPASGSGAFQAATSTHPWTNISSQSQAHLGGSAPHSAPSDLNNFTGDRWMRTSVTCSMTSSAAHSGGGLGRPLPHMITSRAASSSRQPQGGQSDAWHSTRGGLRHGSLMGERQLSLSGIAVAPQGGAEAAMMRNRSLPTLNPPSSAQFPANRTFSVADLMD